MELWQAQMDKKLQKIVFTDQQIQERLAKMATEITDYYRQNNAQEIVVIGILRGAVIMMSDLIRLIPLPVTIDFMAISSYGNSTSSSGTVRILKDVSEAIENRHVLVVEDIVDTGLTLANLKEMLLARKPASLKICTLLNKPSRRKVEIEADFVGFDIADEFVVGYGLDYAGHYRHLPYIGVLKEEVYK